MAHTASDVREPGFIGATLAFIREACNAVADAQHRLTAYNRLDARSDNELQRMGLTRGKIVEYIWRDDNR